MVKVSQMAPSAADLSPYLDRDRLVERLVRLVRTRSENPPGNEKDVADLTAGLCEELGLDVSLHEGEPGRPSVVARWRSGDGPTVGYCSHIDTVPIGDESLWSHDPLGASIEGETLHGRGACDAKGPVAAALEAVAIIRSAGVEPHGTLELELVADEETMGFKGAGYLVDEKIISPDIAIVGEPTSLRIVRAQRGACWVRVRTKGVATHGSAPERGVNAIRHMAEIVRRIEETLPDIEHPVLGGPSISVNTIQGGVKVNIVPASCTIEVDRRSIPGETKESVLENFKAAVELARDAHPDIDAEFEVMFNADPFEIPEESPVVQTVLAAVGDATGEEPVLMGFRGASDARFIADTGADVVLCGPGDIALAHTARESVELPEVATGAVSYAVAFASLLGA
jgi:acetylornithine deacetylase/succinyl-diaminopimelate desuccinylase family protein